ncbi:MAG: zinc ribbon domain-containing protein [Burkholderiales bacterium]|nr:zinc ribbon domain-containing protein [Burkholderiales bacterium]
MIELWVISIIAATIIGHLKGEGGTGFLLALFLGPIGVIITIVLKGDRKVCPFCQEKIHKAARKCPKCQSELPVAVAPAGLAPAAPGRPVTQADKDRMYRNLAIVVGAVIVLIILGPHIQRALR